MMSSWMEYIFKCSLDRLIEMLVRTECKANFGVFIMLNSCTILCLNVSDHLHKMYVRGVQIKILFGNDFSQFYNALVFERL